jgi:glutaredoxin
MNAVPDSPSTPRRAAWVLLALGAAFVAITKFMSAPHAVPVFCDKDRVPTANTVVMLSASWCGYCARARDLFVEKRIDYCEYDIEQSATGAARHRASGARGVPVILVGSDTLLGYERDAVLERIEAQGLTPLPR